MGERILLVDDESGIVSALKRILEAEHFTVITFTDPAEAKAAVADEEFAILVSDNAMPGMSGLELLTFAKTKWPATRRVLMTGATGLDQAVAAFNSGAIHRFMPKPWGRAELVNALRAELATYRAEISSREELTALRHAKKDRTAKLLDTIDQLKQAKTQVALFEDGSRLERFVLPHSLTRLALWVVDENEAVRNLLVSTLKEAGIAQCIGLNSPAEALWRVRDGQEVHVILSEWNMTPMDGLAFVQQLRKESGPSAKALFVLVTTREQRLLVEFALKSGIDGYVIKPFHLQDLCAQIDDLLSKGAAKQDQLASALATRTVIVVNSQTSGGDQIMHLLKSAGVNNVSAVRTGQAGLRQAQERKVDLLLWDLNVKQPDWRELRRELAKLRTPPALLLTSVLPTESEIAEMQKEQDAPFLPGPFRQAELLQALMSVWVNQKKSRQDDELQTP